MNRRIIGPAVLLLTAFMLAACVQSFTPTATPSSLPAAGYTPPAKPTPAQTDTPLPTKAPLLTPEATATSFRTSRILDLAYAGRIWALVGADENGPTLSSAASLTLIGSTDGGQTWDAHSIPGAIQGGNFLVQRLAFLDQNTGWVYGPRLFATQDGGRSWKEIQTSEEIAAVLPASGAGGQTWALAGSCPAAGGNCSYHLFSLDPQAGTLEPLAGYEALRAGQQAVLIRSGEQTAYLFAPFFQGQDQYPFYALWASNGDGSGWKKLTLPNCAAASISLSPDGVFWLLCGDGPSAGNQTKGMYISLDQGQTWELRSATDPWQAPTPPASQPLQTSGYIDSLLALSKDQALVGLDRNTLISSIDGGRDWEEAIQITANDPYEFMGWRLVQKPGSEEVWVAGGTWPAGTRLYHSPDRGKTWDLVAYPE